MVGTRLGVSVADIDECKYLVVWGPLLADLEVAWSGDGCVLRVGGKNVLSVSRYYNRIGNVTVYEISLLTDVLGHLETAIVNRVVKSIGRGLGVELPVILSRKGEHVVLQVGDALYLVSRDFDKYRVLAVRAGSTVVELYARAVPVAPIERGPAEPTNRMPDSIPGAIVEVARELNVSDEVVEEASGY